MLKKFGMVSVGITAGLLAVAPMASATEGHHDHDSDKGHHKSEHKSHEKSHDSDDFNNTCSSEAGDIDNDATGKGLVGVGQVAGPVGSGSNVDVLNCTNILNDFLNDNDVAIGLLGDANA